MDVTRKNSNFFCEWFTCNNTLKEGGVPKIKHLLEVEECLFQESLALSVGCLVLNLSCIHLELCKQPKHGHYIINN